MLYTDHFTAIIAIKDIVLCNLLNRQAREMGLMIKDQVNSGTRLKGSLDKYKPDILFLDIDLDPVEGASLIKAIKAQAQKHLQIIIVTASKKFEHYQAGYDLGITDYVTKPLSPERLALAIKRGRIKLIEKEMLQAFEHSNSINQQKFIHYKNRDGNNVIKESETVYIEMNSERHCSIYLNKGQVLESSSKLADFKQQSTSQIITPHKSFLVNRSYISRICSDLIIPGNYEIFLDGYLKRIPLTRTYYKKFIENI